MTAREVKVKVKVKVKLKLKVKVKIAGPGGTVSARYKNAPPPPPPPKKKVALCNLHTLYRGVASAAQELGRIGTSRYVCEYYEPYLPFSPHPSSRPPPPAPNRPSVNCELIEA